MPMLGSNRNSLSSKLLSPSADRHAAWLVSALKPIRAGFQAWARHPDSDQVIADLEATASPTPSLKYSQRTVGYG
jgi:hypothetical protein